MKEAKGGTINSMGIPLIDTDCYSLKTLLIPGFREKEQGHEEKNGGGGYTLERGFVLSHSGSLYLSSTSASGEGEREMQPGN